MVEQTAGVLGLILTACVLLGMAVRFILVPWLEKRFAPLAVQLQETHHQVTTNGHANPDAPTLKDDLHSLRSEVRELKGETRSDLTRMSSDLTAAGKLYDSHIEWSSRHADDVWRELIDLRKAMGHTEDDGRHTRAADERDER